MKNSRWKRVSALLLTAAMTVSVIPTGALAAEEASQSVTEAEDVYSERSESTESQAAAEIGSEASGGAGVSATGKVETETSAAGESTAATKAGTESSEGTTKAGAESSVNKANAGTESAAGAVGEKTVPESGAAESTQSEEITASAAAPEQSAAESEAAAEPAGVGSLWLTELFPNDFDTKNNTNFGSKDDCFEYVELLNTSDQEIHFNDDFQLLYGKKQDAVTAISVTEPDGSTDVVIGAGETVVFWNRRSDVSNVGTVENFRANYYIDDDVHIVVTNYGKDWATSGYFALQAKSTGTIFSDYTYVNGTIDKTDGGDIADGLGIDLAIPNIGLAVSASTKKAYASPGYVYSEQRGGNTTAPTSTSGLYVTEIYPNDGDRSSVYGASDDLMEFVEVTNTTDQDIDFNQNYQFQYLYKTQGTRLAICTYEDAHKEALGEISINDLYNKSGITIKAGTSAVFWCYRERHKLAVTTAFPSEAEFREAYGIADDVDVYCMIGQNGMKNTDRGVAITASADGGRQVMVSYYHYNGITDTKDKKSVNLAPSAEGPRMTPSAVQQSPTPGGSNGFHFPEDDGSKVELSIREGSEVPAFIMQGEELRVRFDYKVTGSLPRTKITTFYRFDGAGSWKSSSETTRRVPGLYEVNISADEIFDHSYVEFYVCADNQYHRNTTEVYKVEIHKLNEVDGVRTNISDGAEIGGTVTITANNGGDNADTTIQIDGENYPVTKMLEDGAYYTSSTEGRDSYFRNALVLADDNLTDDAAAVRIASLVKWQYYRLNGFAVHIDNQYFTYDAATDSYKITLRFWAGTYGSSVYDFLLPDANREDFKVSSLQLKLINGKCYLPDSIGPESYTYPDTGVTVDSAAKTNLSTAANAIHSVGDSAGMCPYLDASFTIPAADATAVGAVVDTTKLSAGRHTLTVKSGSYEKTVEFIVDNKAPEVEMGMEDGAVLSGEIRLAPQITEENTLAESIITLDGERVNDSVETDSVALGEGDHTLTVYAKDAAGNETAKAVTFHIGDDTIAVVDATTNDVTASSAALTVTVNGNQKGAQAEFRKLESIPADQITAETTQAALPYITYTVPVGETGEDDELVLRWDGTASNADTTHASRMFALNRESGSWDEVGQADDTGSIEANFAAAAYVQEGSVQVMVQCTAGSALPDLSGQGAASLVEDNWDGYRVPAKYDFAFAWETDTQYYSEEFFQHYLNMNNWIVDNADPMNIRYVIHTGDIVDDFDMIYEWENADKAMKILDDAGVPYGVLGGNHDVAAATFEYENYHKYFGEDRMKDQPTYGGSYKNNLGHYDLLTENGQDLIIVYMSWDICQDEIDWMNQVLQQYSDRKAILCFHTYTRVAYTAENDLLDYYGELVQEQVVAKNPNVFAVLNGHYHGASYETTVFDDNNDGVYDRTVYQICTDYQSGFEGGSGYIKMLYFDLAGGKIYINSYTPSLDDFNYYDNEAVTELGVENPANVAADTLEADGGAAPKRMAENINTDILELNVTFDTTEKTIQASQFSAWLDRGEVLGTAEVNEDGTANLTWSDLAAQTGFTWYAVVKNELGSTDRTGVQTFTTLAAPETPDQPGDDQKPGDDKNPGNDQKPGDNQQPSDNQKPSGDQNPGNNTQKPNNTSVKNNGGQTQTGNGSNQQKSGGSVKTGDTSLLLPAVLAGGSSLIVLAAAAVRFYKRKED